MKTATEKFVLLCWALLRIATKPERSQMVNVVGEGTSKILKIIAFFFLQKELSFAGMGLFLYGKIRSPYELY